MNLLELLNGNGGLLYWIECLRSSDLKVGSVMAENSFKVLYKLANENIRYSELYLNLMLTAIRLYSISSKFQLEQADKLIAQIISHHLKQKHDLKKLYTWIEGLCGLKNITQDYRPTCLIWMDLAVKVGWKCKLPVRPIFTVLTTMLKDHDTKFISTIAQLMDSLDTADSESIELTYPKKLSEYHVFALSSLVKLLKFIVDLVWIPSKPNTVAKRQNLDTLGDLSQQLIDLFVQVSETQFRKIAVRNSKIFWSCVILCIRNFHFSLAEQTG